MNLKYNIVYSSRKTCGITVERDRSVVVRAPYGTPQEKIEAIVEKKKLWLYEKVRHVQKHSGLLEEKEFVSGTTILYLGKNYRLEVISDPFDGILFDNKFLISKASVSHAPTLFRDWYFKKAEEKIIPQVQFYAKHLGVNYSNILVSDLKYRWGSCTPKNKLNFNWRLVKAPMRVIEYVIVHELAHLLESNHNAQFWAIIKSLLPDYLKAKEWLKQFGGLLEQQP